MTHALLVEMDRVAREAGARLLVVQLAVRRATTKQQYAALASRHRIDMADCVDPALGRPEMRLRGDPHPNAAMNRVWADCLERVLLPRLATLLADAPRLR